MPAYQDIPLATDKLSVSQDDIKNNFLAIKALVDVNHNTFAAGASPEGKHKKIDFTDLGADPAVVGADVAMYNNGSELFIKKAAGAAIPLTGAATLINNGSTTFPSGLILKWGSSITAAFPDGKKTITYTTPFPTNILAVYATVAVNVGGITTAQDWSIRVYNYAGVAQFSVIGYKQDQTRHAVDFCWLAIGY